MISLSDLTTALQVHWQAQELTGVPTLFPGAPLDATRLKSWFEFWMTTVNEPPMNSCRESLTMLIDVHCFSRQQNKRQVFALADHARRVLAHQTLSLWYPDGADLSTGALRIFEAVVRDLTRDSIEATSLPLQHVVVSLTCRAEKSCLAITEES